MIASLPAAADGTDRGSGPGAWLQRLVIGAGLLVLATCLLAVPLGAVGWWRPWAVLPLLVLTAALIGRLVMGVPTARVERGPAFALAAIGLAAGWWTAATHSTQVLPRRDAGSNLQAAIALADTGHRILPVDIGALGGPAALNIPGLTLASPAFFQVGDAAHPAIQPQFVIGPAAVYSLGRWLGGVDTMLIQPAWLAAIGLLALGLIAAVLLRGWWGPLAAAAIALQFPLLHTARATYSEPLALLTITAGMLAWVLAVRFENQRAAMLAGVLIGGTCLVRIDGLREAILLIPVAALGLIRGRTWPRPLLRGTGIGLVLAFGSALALSYRYLGEIAASLVPLLAMGVAIGALSLVLVRLARRGIGMPPALARVLPSALGITAVAIGLALAARPLFMTVRQDPNDPGARVVAGLQRAQGLRVDGGRTYAEQTVAWLSWWVGPIALGVALLALAALSVRLGRIWTSPAATGGQRRQPLPAWSGPLVVATGSTLMTLWRPGITPDHPWAERRLLMALPLVALLVIAAAAWLWGQGPGIARPDRAPSLPRGSRLRTARLVAVGCIAALVLPTAAATWPHRDERVEAGSLGAVAALCGSLMPGDVVVTIDDRGADEWPQVIRGMCARPAISTARSLQRDPLALRAALDQMAAGLPQGSRLVLLAARSPAALQALDLTGRQVSAIQVREDERLLERRPDTLVPLRLDVWTASYPAPARAS